MLARQITSEISAARTWHELATVACAYGGTTALNEIHLAAALSRLAKMDLTVPRQPSTAPSAYITSTGSALLPTPASPVVRAQQTAHPQAQQAQGGPPSRAAAAVPSGPVPGMQSPPWPGSGPSPRALPLAPPSPNRSQPGPPPPPPPPPSGPLRLTPLSRTPGPAPLGVPIQPPTPPGPPRAPAHGPTPAGSPASRAGAFPQQPTAQLGAARGALPPPATATQPPPPPVTPQYPTNPPALSPASSPEELYLGLLEELALRCSPGAGEQGRRVSGGSGSGGGGSLPAVTAAAAAPPPPARVLANGTWAATKLLPLLCTRQQKARDAGGPEQRAAAAGTSGAGPTLAPGAAQARQPAAPTSRAAAAAATRGRAVAALRALLSRIPAAAAELEPQHISNLFYSLAQLAEHAPEALAMAPDGDSATEDVAEEEEAADEGEEGLLGAARLAQQQQGPGVAGGRTLPGARRVAGLVRRLLAASRPKLEAFGPQALSNSLYSLASLGISPPSNWMEAWIAASAAQMRLADPQHIANMLWAMARIRYHPGDPWVMEALRAAALKARAFTTQGLCNALWALAKLDFSADSPTRGRALLPLLAGLGAAAGECSGQDVANGMWALARLEALRPPGPQAAASADPIPGTHPAYAALPTYGSQQPQSEAQPQQHVGDAASTEGSAAAREALQAAALALLTRSCRQLHAYNGQQLANTAWAAAALQLAPPPGWEAAFWPAALRALPCLRTDELVAVAMASARLRLTPPDAWHDALLEVTSAAMRGASDVAPPSEEALPSGAATPPPRFQPTGRALASLLWCVAATGLRVPAAWTCEVLARLEALAAEGALEAASLATALQALARSGLRPDGLIAGWTRRVMERHVAAVTGVHPLPPGPGMLQGGSGAHARATAVQNGDALSAAGVMAGKASGKGGSGAEATAAAAVAAVEGDVGLEGYEPRAARMLLWALVLLDCRVSSATADALALAAAGCGEAADSEGGSSSVPAPTGTGTNVTEAQSADAGLVTSEARDVGLALWALARVAERPSTHTMRMLVRRAFQVMPAASARDVLAVLRALSELGFRPGARFWAALEERVRRLAPELREGARLVQSYCARLEWRLAADTLEALRLD